MVSWLITSAISVVYETTYLRKENADFVVSKELTIQQVCKRSIVVHVINIIIDYVRIYFQDKKTSAILKDELMDVLAKLDGFNNADMQEVIAKVTSLTFSEFCYNRKTLYKNLQIVEGDAYAAKSQKILYSSAINLIF